MMTRSKEAAGSPRTPKRDYREQPMDYEEAFGESPDPDISLSDDSFGSAADGELDDEDAELSKLFGSAMLTHHSDNLPSCYQEAMKSPESHKWKAAMSEEMESLRQSHTWELVPLPKGRKLIANRWVFTTKRDRAGNVLRQKARLVAKGFTQRKGIDFQETFAPVIRFESLRMLLAVAAHKRMAMTQFDVKTAFLNGTIEEEIYMSQPEGFEDGTNRVCRLIKGLYGLKQSPRAWNHEADKSLRGLGLKQLKSDPCVYTRLTSNCNLYLALYVDDGLILSDNQSETQKLIKSLKSKFKITLSSGEKYIGLEIDQAPDGSIVISQEAYVKEVLLRFNMQDCKPIGTPADPSNPLSSDMSPRTDDERKEMEKIPYKQAVGALMFLACVSRLDIAFAMSVVTRFFADPGLKHWQAVKRILRNIQKAPDMSIIYHAGGDILLEAFADSDHAGNQDTRKSTSGVLLTISGSPVVWCSKKQTTVSMSTTQSEHNSIADTTREVIWAREFLNELGEKQEGPAAQ